MPFFRDKNMEDQEDPSQSVQVSSSGMQAGPSGATAGRQQQKPLDTGSHFTNIDTYLNNNNAQGFGQQFGGKVQDTVNQSQNTVQNATQDVMNQVQNSPKAASQDQINSAVSNAGANTTQADADQYQQWLKQSYQGPRSLSDNASAQSRVTGAIDKANAQTQAATTEPGRFALLDQYFGRPNYNFGEKSLDNLMIQGGGGFTNGKALQDQAASIGSYADQQKKAIANAAAERSGELEASQNAARAAIGIDANNNLTGTGAFGDFQNTLDKKVQDLNTQRTQDWNNIQADLVDPTWVNGSTQSMLGLAPGQNLYNLNLGDYVTQGNPATRQEVASDDDYARYLALSQLAGLDPTYLTPDTRNQAGQVPAEATFDTNRFTTDVQAANADWQHGMLDAENAYYPGNGFSQFGYSTPQDYQAYLDTLRNRGDVAAANYFQNASNALGGNRVLNGPNAAPTPATPPKPTGEMPTQLSDDPQINQIMMQIASSLNGRSA